ncbi:MAG: PHP domain-containing protein [Richelia sp. RM2_1_2]|nr:PHP domain-containing protein [Richelia sp. SM2_1_7]NJM20230.1 PHP domain-containing protein [Richelia sp. SM1_7_0]NJO63518.1 PHP domain-containing protein [Richelia sp. RM2_1_2]
MVVNFARTCASKTLLKEVFQSLDAQSCPNNYNFHMHTVCSDGKIQPSELMQQAINIGLKGLAVTDHHSTKGYQAAQKWLEDWKSNNPDADAPYLWSGVEINANLLNVEVHILGYAFEPQHPSIQPYTQGKLVTGSEYQAVNVIAAIQQAGGLAVLAHPARYRRTHFDLIPAAAQLGIDGVESFYAYNNPKPWKPSPTRSQQIQRLAAEYGLYSTCGTDTHGLSLLQRL